MRSVNSYNVTITLDTTIQHSSIGTTTQQTPQKSRNSLLEKKCPVNTR